ncbi:MAG: hypothetical protein QOD92_3580 [Acidimicrobiaceae bacterium]
MIRRSFRIGLWLGLLAGIGVALSKILRSKPEPLASPRDWPPLEAPIPTPTPVTVAEPDIEPVVAAEEPGLVLIGDEPLQEPEPAPAPAPAPASAPAPVVSAPVAKKPAEKKPAAKKTEPAKKAAAPAKKVAVKKRIPAWVDPSGTICPKTHPVKGKLSSNIYQVPGNFAYERTTPDRCYKNTDAAEDDGLRAAKR